MIALHDKVLAALEAGPEVAPSEGLVPRLMTRLFFRGAQVSGNQRIAPGLHRITLQGPALRGLRWFPGDKLQLKLGPGLRTRTYTPIRWDAERGETEFIAHTLAAGPGSDWVRHAAPGQAVQVMGPRASLDLARFDPSRALLAGDETAIGLAAAWRPLHAFFEVDGAAGCTDLLRSLDLQATVVGRQPGDLQLDALANALLGLARPDSQFVLAGRARSVQHLLRALRVAGVPSGRILTKAYWAEGKVGLD